jgi:hypothetical protein
VSLARLENEKTRAEGDCHTGINGCKDEGTDGGNLPRFQTLGEELHNASAYFKLARPRAVPKR